MPNSFQPRARFAIFILLTSLVFLGLIWRWANQVPDILSASTKIGRPQNFTWYSWESGNRILWLGCPSPGNSTLLSLNPEDGSINVDSRLKQLMGNPEPYLWNLSPNGEFLFIGTLNRSSDLPVAYALNSNRKVVCSSDIALGSAQWLPSSKGLVSVSQNGPSVHFEVFNIENGKQSSMELDGQTIGSIVGLADDDTIIFTSKLAASHDQLDIVRVSISKKAIVSRKSIYFSDDANLSESLVSPDGRSLAISLWESNSRQRDTYPLKLFRRWTTEQHEWRLMVIDLQSGRTRTLGRYLQTNLTAPTPGSIAWHPDSRHVSFRIGGQLYKCSATAN